MSTKNNLQSALKNAFENHEAPLKEAQWERLEGVLLSNKPKRIFLPFLFTSLLICLTAGITYFLTLNYALENKKSVSDTRNSNTSQNKISNTSINSFNSTSDKTKSLSNKPEIKTFTSILSNQRFSNKTLKSRIDKILESIEGIQIVSIETEAEKKSETSLNEPENSEFTIEKSSDSFKQENKEETNDIAIVLTDSAIDKSSTIKKDDNPLLPAYKPASKFVISLSAGYSKMNQEIIEIKNNQNLHKDSRMLYDQSNQNPNILFLNLGIDYNFLPRFNIGLNSGIQYLQINNQVNIKYKLNEIPLRDQEKIVGYIPLPDDQIKELNSNTINTTTYINVPLRFNYTLPINLKNEVLLTGGANFSTIVSAKGKTIDVNEGEVKPLEKSRYNKFSTGFLGGIQFSHNLKNAWWLGSEAQWLSNKMNFEVGSGSILTKFQGYRVNLILKYKI